MSKELSNWSIEKELLKLSGCQDLYSAIIKLGLMAKNDRYLRIEGAPAWVVGGSETYVYPFSIVLETGYRKNFILKAIATFSPGSALDLKLVQWISRRDMLRRECISVPQLFFHGQGVILEEFVPYALSDVLRTEGNHHGLLSQLFYYAGSLSRLGFRPIDAFVDLRTDGYRVYVIDFGEDLGPALNEGRNHSSELYKAAVEAALSCGVTLSADQLRKYYCVFLSDKPIEDRSILKPPGCELRTDNETGNLRSREFS